MTRVNICCGHVACQRVVQHAIDADATYSDGRRVKFVGERGGFRYITFEDGVTTKVPSSWVTLDAAGGAQ